MQQEEELQLLFGKAADRGHQHGHVRIDLLPDHSRRVPLRRFEIATILRTRDLHYPLGGATDCADLVTACRAGSLDWALVADGTGHEDVCNSRAYRVTVATVWRGMIPFRGLWVSPNSDRERKNPKRLDGV